MCMCSGFPVKSFDDFHFNVIDFSLKSNFYGLFDQGGQIGGPPEVFFYNYN